jgi:hypothetical protein
VSDSFSTEFQIVLSACVSETCKRIVPQGNVKITDNVATSGRDAVFVVKLDCGVKVLDVIVVVSGVTMSVYVKLAECVCNDFGRLIDEYRLGRPGLVGSIGFGKSEHISEDGAVISL